MDRLISNITQSVPHTIVVDKLDQQLAASIHGNFDLSWRLTEELARERPQCNRCAFNRGWELLSKGRLSEGYTQLNRGRWERVFGSPPLTTQKPIFNQATHSPKGSKILLRGEGGLGDEIVNVRFAQDLAVLGTDEVIVSCSKPLRSVFERVLGVTRTVLRDSEQERTTNFDYWVPAMSAPTVLNTEYVTLGGKPYLIALKTLDLPKLRNTNPKATLRIGIRWSGNPEFEHQQHRIFDKNNLIDLVTKYSSESTQFYSFQRDVDLVDDLPGSIVDLADNLPDWETTLAYMDAMDLVITSCTSIAHAAAALGKPTWVIVPILPYYIWALPGNTSPWYDSVKLFRQEVYKEWHQTFTKLDVALGGFING